MMPIISFVLLVLYYGDCAYFCRLFLLFLLTCWFPFAHVNCLHVPLCLSVKRGNEEMNSSLVSELDSWPRSTKGKQIFAFVPGERIQQRTGRRWEQPGPLRETLRAPVRVFRVSVSGLLTASGWFLLNSCPDITPLAWWRSGPDYCDGGRRQPVTTDFRHCFPYPRFAPSGLL